MIELRTKATNLLEEFIFTNVDFYLLGSEVQEINDGNVFP